MDLVKRVGLFGGCFDPIHRAHIALAKAAANQFNLSTIRFVPTGFPAQKTPSASFTQRCTMVKIAINNSRDKRLVIDKGETYDSARGPNYSFETIMRVQKELPDSELFLILGEDQFVNFRTWKNWKWILQNINLAVCARPHNGMDKPKISSKFLLNEFREGFKEKIFIVNLKPDDSSSTMVRSYVKKNMGLGNMIDVDVFEYIKRSKLYQN